jgi:nucleoside-diphosphate-sugar epimerase
MAVRGMRQVVNPPSFAPTGRRSPRGLPSLLEDLREFIYGESSAFDDPVKRSAFQVAVVPWKHHGSVVGDAHQHLVAATLPVVDKSQLPESAFDVSRRATRQPRAHRPTVPMGDHQPIARHMKAALVTGASGFLGGNLVAALCRRGVKVRALVRPTSDLHRLSGLGAEIVRGDVCDLASLREAARGQQVVFHAAAKVPDWGPRREFFRVNLDGTRKVVAACQDAGVERLVHVSSMTVLGLPRHGAAVDEQSPYDPSPKDAYTASKIAAEEDRACGKWPARSLRPSRSGQGRSGAPGDPSITPRIAALLRRGRAVYIGRASNRLALSHVDNLTLGLRLAAETPAAAGQVYHLTDGETVTAREVIDGLAALLGTARPRWSVPFFSSTPPQPRWKGWRASCAGAHPRPSHATACA